MTGYNLPAWQLFLKLTVWMNWRLLITAIINHTPPQEQESAPLQRWWDLCSLHHCCFNSACLQHWRWPVSFQGQSHKEQEDFSCTVGQEAVYMSWISWDNFSILCFIKVKWALPVLGYFHALKDWRSTKTSERHKRNFCWIQHGRCEHISYTTDNSTDHCPTAD